MCYMSDTQTDIMKDNICASLSPFVLDPILGGLWAKLARDKYVIHLIRGVDFLTSASTTCVNPNLDFCNTNTTCTDQKDVNLDLNSSDTRTIPYDLQ